MLRFSAAASRYSFVKETVVNDSCLVGVGTHASSAATDATVSTATNANNVANVCQ